MSSRLDELVLSIYSNLFQESPSTEAGKKRLQNPDPLQQEFWIHTTSSQSDRLQWNISKTNVKQGLVSYCPCCWQAGVWKYGGFGSSVPGGGHWHQAAWRAVAVLEVATSCSQDCSHPASSWTPKHQWQLPDLHHHPLGTSWTVLFCKSFLEAHLSRPTTVILEKTRASVCRPMSPEFSLLTTGSNKTSCD